jgi:hypothetical protein
MKPIVNIDELDMKLAKNGCGPRGGCLMGAGLVLRGRDKPLLDYWDGEDIGEEE